MALDISAHNKLICSLVFLLMAFDLGVGYFMNEEALSPYGASPAASRKGCVILGTKGQCDYCDCTGRYCQSRFPGMKVEWPELEGIPALQAKKRIEKDNPKVKVDIYMESIILIEIICCNRVIIRVPDNNCPNGPVINKPQVG